MMLKLGRGTAIDIGAMIENPGSRVPQLFTPNHVGAQ